MVNTQYLEELIDKSGKSKTYLAKKLGCSRTYFYSKCKNEAPITTDEANILCDELNITKLAERDKVFFAKNVDKMST